MSALLTPVGPLTPTSKPGFSSGERSLRYGISQEIELGARVKEKQQHALLAAAPLRYFVSTSGPGTAPGSGRFTLAALPGSISTTTFQKPDSGCSGVADNLNYFCGLF